MVRPVVLDTHNPAQFQPRLPFFHFLWCFQFFKVFGDMFGPIGAFLGAIWDPFGVNLGSLWNQLGSNSPFDCPPPHTLKPLSNL